MYTCMLHRLCIYIHIIMCIYIYTHQLYTYLCIKHYIYHISLWKLPLPLQPLSDPCHVKPRFTSSAISAMGVETLGENRQDPRKKTMSGWWYTYPSEKYESQLGLIVPIYGTIKFMFQTTNQVIQCMHLWSLKLGSCYQLILSPYYEKYPPMFGTSSHG